MSPSTRKAIELLMAADPSVSEADRVAVAAVLADEWIRAADAAKRLDCSVRWLRWQVSAGQWSIRRERVGHRTTLYKAADVDRIRRVVDKERRVA